MAQPSATRHHGLRRRARHLDIPDDAHNTHSFSLASLAPTAPVETSTETIHPKRKREVHRELGVAANVSPVKRVRQSDDARSPAHSPVPGPSTQNDMMDYTMSFGDEDDPFSMPQKPPEATKKRKRKATHTADPAMATWVAEYRAEFLDSLLWLDGRGTDLNLSSCPACERSTHEPKFRCCSCHPQLVCQDCIVLQHAKMPYHWIEEWNGTYFRRTSLKKLGLRIQVGHAAGETCSLPQPGHQDFTILHDNGIHSVALDFCGCAFRGRVPHAVQLLRSRLYPSTGSKPQTCCTFACLDSFHAASLHGKISAYDYYRSLEYLSDGSGVKPVDRYKPFLRMTRQYRHLLILKRGGRGHTSDPIHETPPGSLAIRCPACPRPGVNLPEDWQNASPEDRCLYIMFIAIDACFRLKRRLIGSDFRDPGLTTGFAYMELCRFVIPKLHINAHILICRVLFSLALVPGSGMTDGEAIERLWAAVAGLAGSTKLSGHGGRADQLDDHWAFWNWLKLVTLAKQLRRRSDNARNELEKQLDSFRLFSAQQAEHVPRWLEMAEVRRVLEEEERKELDDGGIPLHTVSATEFIVFALDLETQQRRLCIQIQLKRSQSNQKIRLKPLRKKLVKGIARLRELQATYMPMALVHLKSLEVSPEALPETIPLLLPSSLPGSFCSEQLLLIYKKRQSRHQRMNTRSRALVTRNEEKIKTRADTYQAGQRALVSLEPTATWPVLLASDICCLEDADDISKREARNRRQLETRLKRQLELIQQGLITVADVQDVEGDDESDGEEEDKQSKKTSSGESRRTISWIWTMAGSHGTDEAIQEALRIKWCKARVFGSNAASTALQMKDNAATAEGRAAYAAKQAALFRQLVSRAEAVRTEARKGRGHRADATRASDPFIADDTPHPDVEDEGDSDESDSDESDSDECDDDGRDLGEDSEDADDE
ncbi:CxC2 domain-containing protein [Mycena kentingensis (nom. inval.)]|nr:CxC2 domain-containing protein [Mycena kentingensis (nom. inval.)]